MTRNPTILVVNCGSSSVKFAFFADERAAPRRLASGALERIGLPDGRFSATMADGGILFDKTRDIPNHVAALEMLLSEIEERRRIRCRTCGTPRVAAQRRRAPWRPRVRRGNCAARRPACARNRRP